MSNDNYAIWESDDSKIDKSSYFETQFNENKKAINNQYSRDDINDKLSQRGMLPSAFPNQFGDSSNNNYTGRLDHEVHSRKQQMNNSNNNNSNTTNNNPIFDHQFFNNKGEYKYNEPLGIINSRNFNKK